MACNQRYLNILASMAATAALYLAFAAKLTWSEYVMAAVIAALAVVAAQRLNRGAGRPRWVLVPPLWWFAKLLLNLATESWLVCRELATSSWGPSRRGQFRHMPFDSGDDELHAAARRVWVTLGKSLAPNGIVVAIDRAERQLVLHELVPSGTGTTSKEWPA